ncbi:MAG: OB-fold domain-containing protein [Nitrosopumilus sp.]|nr:OB-fold domain-containing protein [Nitrosopumilus sp.]MDA7958555.1 OB-fold domain-containing protein [Nitrosopumilus sp.]MDA7960641.1 OB-fold domain-containing protein [Nitrosopumilus sp.]
MTPKERMAECARRGRFLAASCSKCSRTNPCTARFCLSCGSPDSEPVEMEGTGRVATYTIITVPPAGFEEHVPYAFVVMALDGSDLRISGFMAGISAPADLPVGSPARIAGFDERGIILERT